MDPGAIDASVVGGGGVIAFAAAVLFILRQHLGKVELILADQVAATREQTAAYTRLAVVLERQSGQLAELRDDVTPPPYPLEQERTPVDTPRGMRTGYHHVRTPGRGTPERGG